MRSHRQELGSVTRTVGTVHAVLARSKENVLPSAPPKLECREGARNIKPTSHPGTLKIAILVHSVFSKTKSPLSAGRSSPEYRGIDGAMKAGGSACAP